MLRCFKRFLANGQTPICFFSSTFKYSMIHQTRSVHQQTPMSSNLPFKNPLQWRSGVTISPSCHLPSQSARCGCHPRHRPGLSSRNRVTTHRLKCPDLNQHASQVEVAACFCKLDTFKLLQQLQTFRRCNFQTLTNLIIPWILPALPLCHLSYLSDLFPYVHLQRSPTSSSLRRWPRR